MFKIGVYKLEYSEDNTRLFLYAPYEGFQISSFSNLKHERNWSPEFSEEDKDFILSEKFKEKVKKEILLLDISKEKQQEISEYLYPEIYEYKIDKRMIISGIGIIKIKDISRIEKIEENKILLNISGEMKTILCNEYDKLFKLMIEKEEL